MVILCCRQQTRDMHVDSAWNGAVCAQQLRCLCRPLAGLPVIRLDSALRAWNTDDFAAALKSDILALGAGVLPLQEAAAGGSIDEGDIDITLLGSRDSAAEIHATVGVFFAEVIGGCSCGDEPAASNAYCELQVIIHKVSGQARFEVLHD